jgi:multidrug efflux pump subunit AcrA (membrane-fusion protein)
MGKIAKVLLGLVMLLSVLMPSAALKVRSRIFEHEQTISDLEQTLQETRDELADTRQKLADTQEELARTKRDLDSARAQIRRLEGELSTEKQAKEKAQADLRTRTQELASARDEIRNKDTQISNLNSRVSRLEGEKKQLEEQIVENEEEIATLKKIAGVSDLGVDDTALAEGRVISAEAGVLTASFGGNLGVLPWSNLFISRRGRITGRVQLKQLHATNVVFEFPKEFTEAILPGDFLVLAEEANILIPENFEGVVSRFQRQGFATIEIAEKAYVSPLPMISVYRNEELIIEAVPDKITDVFTVAELHLTRDVNVMNSDVVRIGK